MKRKVQFFFALIAFMLLFSQVCFVKSSPSVNFVTNADFDVDTSNWNASVGTLNQSNEQAHGGLYSLKTESEFVGGSEYQGVTRYDLEVGSISNQLAIHYFSIWVYCNATPSNDFQVILNWYNDIFENGIIYVASFYKGPGWQEYAWTGQPGEFSLVDGFDILVSASAYVPISFYIDDVYFSNESLSEFDLTQLPYYIMLLVIPPVIIFMKKKTRLKNS